MGEGSLARLFLLSDSHITKDIYRNNMISSNFSLNNTQTKRTFNQFKNFNMFKLTYGWDTLQTCMKHRGRSPTSGSKNCFSWSPVERLCYHNREPGHLISSDDEVCIPSLRCFPELPVPQGLKKLSCSRKGIPSVLTVVVSYEWPCMPCDIIAMLPTGHRMIASPLKCTNLRTPATFGCNVS